MTPSELFPSLAPAIRNMPNVWPAYAIKPQFASWEVLHIVSLIVLGGATILLNLRLIGVGVTSESPSDMHRNLRLWLNIGVIGIVVSGLLIGMANAQRLYNSNAFTVKILALLAGLIFTYGVSGPVARANGAVSRSAKIWCLAGLAVFLFAIGVFATSRLINPGLFHLLTAAALVVLFVSPGRWKWLYLGGLLVLVAAQWVGTHVIVHQGDFARLDPTNKAFAVVFALWILGFAGYELFAVKRGPESPPLTQAIGYLTIFVWVTAAAAGRWIAFA
ncbi:MAG: DUF6644 family protein [Caulobacteraceae bacterium]